MRESSTGEEKRSDRRRENRERSKGKREG